MEEEKVVSIDMVEPIPLPSPSTEGNGKGLIEENGGVTPRRFDEFRTKTLFSFDEIRERRTRARSVATVFVSTVKMQYVGKIPVIGLPTLRVIRPGFDPKLEEEYEELCEVPQMIMVLSLIMAFVLLFILMKQVTFFTTCEVQVAYLFADIIRLSMFLVLDFLLYHSLSHYCAPRIKKLIFWLKIIGFFTLVNCALYIIAASICEDKEILTSLLVFFLIKLIELFVLVYLIRTSMKLVKFIEDNLTERPEMDDAAAAAV
eukprot:TRINITY_DN1505_c0_g2_i1.p1 TRINITY_DN1505_c0_g2~~TRINITY_DN1505_c0_g2_i1.p1  ORF type:complete len:259 (+),score=52.01 TRINITY_DN1505_c0_g2_i1:67-843(+)